METHQFIYPIFVAALGLVLVTLCIVAEFKKTKKKDMRFDGKLCYLPASVAFELGIGALICLLMAQVIGNLLICRTFFSRDSSKAKKNPTLLINVFICALSWMSFVMAIILIGAASSMSKSEPFGEGWVDGQRGRLHYFSNFDLCNFELNTYFLHLEVEIRWQHTSTS